MGFTWVQYLAWGRDESRKGKPFRKVVVERRMNVCGRAD